MRYFMTLALVLFLAVSLTVGCSKQRKSSSSTDSNDEVADNNASAGGSTTGGTPDGAGMGGTGNDEMMDDEEMADEAGDLADGFEGQDDPAEEGMDDEDLAAGFEGDEGFDPAEAGAEADDPAGFAGPGGTGDPGEFAGPDGTGDPASAGGGQRPAQRKPATLLDAAKQSFARSENRNGFNYAFAAILLDKEAGPKLLSQYQWVPALSRPALGVRWGIGIHFIGAKDAAKNPYPIGVDQKLPEKRSSSRNRNRGDDLAGNLGDDLSADPGLGDDSLTGGFPGSGSGQGGSSDLKKYTGVLGEKVVQRLRGRIERGYYGSILKMALAEGGSARPQGNFPGGGGIGAGGFDPADEGLDPADEGLDPAGAGIDPGSGGGFGRRRGGNQGMPAGVTMLGVGNLEELAAKARQNDLDAVIIFEVKVAVSRKTKLVTNNTTIQLFDVQEGKVVKKHKTTLNNVKLQIQSKSAKGNEVDEMIEKEIDQIFLAAESYRFKELPANLTAENVLKFRVAPMVKKDYENPLPMLAELHFWSARQLLTPAHLAVAYTELLDEQLAKQLLSGDDKVKVGIVKTWLPGGANARESSSTPFR